LLAVVSAVVAFVFLLFWWRNTQAPTRLVTPSITSLSALAEVQPPAPSKPAAKPVKSIEVCGFGKVTLDDSDSAIAGTEIEARIAKDMIRWHSALLNSGDVRARAAGLFIDSKFGGDSVRATPSPQSLDSLVQLAQETHDPAVYATALAACKIRCRQCGSVVGAGRRCACCQ
jgi:hypothetical protein